MPLDPNLRNSITGNAQQEFGPAESDLLAGRPKNDSSESSSQRVDAPEPLQKADPSVEQPTGELPLIGNMSPVSSPAINGEESGNQSAEMVNLSNQVRRLSAAVEALGQFTKPQDISSALAELKNTCTKLERVTSALTSSLPEKKDNSTEALSRLLEAISGVTERQAKNDRQLTQMLRENANFQVQVRNGMQKDLDRLKEQQRGVHFIPILKQVASIYADYQMLLRDDSITGIARKNLVCLFDDLEDLLGEYNAEVIRSQVGTIRQPKFTKIAAKIPTGDAEKHNTVACSRTPGFVFDRTVLCPEFVEVYIYDPNVQSVEPVSDSGPAATGAESATEEHVDEPFDLTSNVEGSADDKTTAETVQPSAETELAPEETPAATDEKL